MPIPVRRLWIGRPGQNRTDVSGISDRGSAIELPDKCVLAPRQGVEPWSSGLEAAALPLSYRDVALRERFERSSRGAEPRVVSLDHRSRVGAA